MLGHELVEGGFEGDFFADDQAFSELGLGLIPKLADSDSCCRRFYQDIHCKNIQTSNGILTPRSAQTMAPMSQHLRRLVLVSGIVGILLSLYLLASFPVTAIWLLGVLLGIQLICEGAALGYLAWQVRSG
jgi:hypothetical protein